MDTIPNEVLKNEACIDILCSIYNACLQRGVIPDLWRQALISPIFKGKGKSRNDPLSYRPVSLISNPCKGVCYILNKRLLSHLEEQNMLVEEQNGFRQGRRCQDHIFSLVMILKNLIDQKKSTFCCFVDYSAAFDLVDRDLLLFALLSAGVDHHMIKVIREMYSCAVRVNNSITQWFMIRAGVRQGQNDSPTAFAVFINSLAVELKQLNIGITIGHSKVSILLFADDIVLITEKENELQTFWTSCIFGVENGI